MSTTYVSESITLAAATVTEITGDVRILQPDTEMRLWFGSSADANIDTKGLKVPADGWAEPWKMSTGRLWAWAATETLVHLVR